MAVKTDTELTTQAAVIRDETVELANTKIRVYDILKNIVDSKISLKSWDFAANGNAFPASDAATLYIVVNGDHGVLGDADYVPDKAWMICLAPAASAFANYIIKP